MIARYEDKTNTIHLSNEHSEKDLPLRDSLSVVEAKDLIGQLEREVGSGERWCEMVKRLEKWEGENGRLRAALEYIVLLANRQNPHLGHPRAGDVNCIFCMGYFALHNGDFGCEISEADYIEMKKSAEKQKGGAE